MKKFTRSVISGVTLSTKQNSNKSVKGYRVIKPILLLCILLFGLSGQSFAQYTQVTNTSGTVTYGAIGVTVTSSGSASSGVTCGSAAQPYILTQPATYNFNFSLSLPSVRIPIIFGASTDPETVSFTVNGLSYAITSGNIISGVTPNCGDATIAVASGGNLTNAGDFTGLPSAIVQITGTINSVSITFSGSAGNQALAGMFVPSDIAPTFVNGSPQSLSVCQNSGAVPINSLLAINDPDAGQTETWTTTSGAAHGTVGTGGTQTSTGGTVTPAGFTYTPNSGYTGADAFTMQVSDGAGGTASTVINVTVNPLPVITATATPNPLCAGATLSLNATPSGGSGTYSSFSWSGPASFTATTQNTTRSGVTTGSSGIYSVTVTDNNGCVSPAGATSTVTVNALPTITSVSATPNPLCVGATINLSATGVSGTGSPTYNWSGPNTYISASAAPSFTATTTAASGVYSLTVTYPGAGCTSAGSVTSTVSVNALPTISSVSASPNPLCVGTTINLSATGVSGTGSPTYSWTGPNSYVSASAAPSFTATTTAASGVYSLAVTYTGAGCTSTTSVTSAMSVNAVPTITSVSATPNPLCVGTAMNLSATGVSGTGSPTYSWTGPNSFVSPSAAPSFTATTTAASGVYSLTVTYAGAGCTSAIAVTSAVSVNALPTIAGVSASPNPLCTGTAMVLSATGVSGTGSPAYSWSGPNSYASTAIIPSFTATTTAASGVYSLTVSYAGAGCASATSVTSPVTVNALPTIGSVNGNAFPLCVGSTINLNATSVAGTGTPAYNWSGPNGYTSTSLAPSFTATTTAASGVYSLTVTYPGSGCTSATSVTAPVTVNALPTITSLSATPNPLCIGTTLNLSATGVSGTGAPTYSWVGPNSFVSASPAVSFTTTTTAASGVYSLTVTYPGTGCVSATSATSIVSVNAVPTITSVSASPNPLCVGTVISLSATGVTGTGSATYSWSGPNSYVSASVAPSFTATTTAASGVYSLTVSYPGSGCTSATSVTSAVTVNVLPTISGISASPNPLCIGSTLNLSAASVTGAGTPTYSWSGPNSFVSATVAPSFTATTTASSGVYSLTVTYPGTGCTSATSVTPSVSVNAVSTISSVSASPNPLCTGTAITLSATGVSGTGAATYSWSGPNSYASTGIAPSFTATTTTASGIYSLTVSYPGAGCTSTTSVTSAVTVNALPTTSGVSASPNPLCIGTTLNLSATSVSGTGSPTYNWTGPNSFVSGSAAPSFTPTTTAASGVYSLTVSYPGTGCTSATSVTQSVSVNAVPTISSVSASPNPLCVGATINLSATGVSGTGAVTYSWSGPNSFVSAGAAPSFTATTTAASGVYSLTVTYPGAGCASATSVTSTVTVNALPTIGSANSNPFPLCVGATINLSATGVTGTGTPTYNWTGPNSFVSTNPSPSFTATTTAAGGVYSLTVTYPGGGCTSATAVTSPVVVNTLPTIGSVIASPNPLCVAATLNLSAAGVSGTGSPTYNWSGPNSFVSASVAPSFTATTTAAGGVYSLTVTYPGTGCTSATSVSPTVSVNAVPTITSASATPGLLCVGTAITLNATGVTGTGAPTYSWSGPNSYASTAVAPSFTATTSAASGVYSLTVTYPGSGCTSATSVTNTVTVNALPTITSVSASPNPLCVGTTINLSATGVSGSGSPTYNWAGPNSYASTSITPSFTATTTAASGVYSLTVTSPVTGCTSATSVTSAVTVNALPTITSLSASPNPLCVGATINLSATGVSGTGTPAYSWSGPNSFVSASAAPSFTATTTAASGVYSLAVTYPGAGCASATSVTIAVSVNAVPTIGSVTGNPFPLCVGSTINLSATGVAGTGSPVYNWTGPNGFVSAIPSPSFTATTTAAGGIYSLTVTYTGAGCTSAVSVTGPVTVNALPTITGVSASPNPLCIGATINLSATGVSGTGSPTYSWSGPNSFVSASVAPAFTATTTAAGGVYSLTVTYPGTGCTSATSVTPTVSVNLVPTITSVSETPNPLCVGTAINLNATGVSGTGAPTYNWSGPNSYVSTAVAPLFTATTTAASGVYSLTVTYPGSGCTSATSVTSIVTVNAAPAITSVSASPNPLCIGTTINLSATGVSGTGTPAYSWTGPNSFVSASVSPSFTATTTAASGVYSLTVSYSGLGCTATAFTSAVSVNAVPTIASVIASPNPLCIGTTLNLSATGVSGTGSPTYNWSGPNSYVSASIAPSFTATTTAASGIYSLTVTYPGAGCTSAVSATPTVTVNAGPTITSVSASPNPLCVGTAISLSATGVSGTGTPTYSWTGPNSYASASVTPSFTATTTAASGVYSLTVTYPGSGCTSATSVTPAVTVNVFPSITSVSASPNPLCVGATINLSATGVSGTGTPVYSWSGPNSFVSASATPSFVATTTATSGVYSLTVTYPGTGCTSATSVTPGVTVNALPTITGVSAAPNPLCVGTAINLSATGVTGTGAPTYSWNGPNSYISAIVAPSFTATTTAASGVYSLTVTYPGAGCTSAISVTPAVTVNALPTISGVSASPNPLCVGTAINLSTTGVSGTGSPTYSWSGPNSFISASVAPSFTATTTAASGVYSLAVTYPGSGCTSAISVTPIVSVNALPTITSVSALPNPLCVGTTINLSATGVSGTGSPAYSWNGPNSYASASAAPSFTATTTAASGAYSLTVTFPGAGCTSAAAVTGTVTVNAVPTIATVSASPNPICVGNSLSLSATGVSGTGSPSYSWSGPNSYASTGVAPSFTVTTTASGGVYSLTVTYPGAGCTSATSRTSVVTVNPLPAPITGLPSLCIGLTTSLNDATTGGLWTSNNTSIATIGSVSGIATGVIAGLDTVKYTLPTTCFVIQPIAVYLPPVPIIAPSGVCVGSTIIASDASGGGTWSSSNTLVATVGSISGVVMGLIAPSTVTISYSLGFGCNATAVVSVNPLPTPILGVTFMCAGATTALTDAGGGTWSSSDNSRATVNGSGVVTGVAAGTSNITYTLPTGCVTTTVVTVNVVPLPIEGTLSVCQGATTTLGDPSGTGTWTSGTTAVATIGSGSGVVTGGTTLSTSTITYTLPDGCATTAVVSVNGLPATITGTANVLCIGGGTTLTETTTGGTWGSTNTTIASINSSGVVTAVAAGTTTFTYTTAAGCISSIAYPITVNLFPAAITGATSVCSGSTTTLADAITGGSWSSSSSAVASIGSVTGLVTGGANPGGVVTITYNSATGCSTNTSFTVNPTPAAITGTNHICAGSTTSLTETTTGGTWSSSNTAVATVGSTGIVSGITAGTVGFIYTPAAGCATPSFALTVNPLPAAITGVMSVCLGSTTLLEDGISGGTWSSSNSAQASVGSTTGVVTGGTSGTNPVITYTLPTSCAIAATLTINPLPVAFPVFGGGAYCSGGEGLHIELIGSASGFSYQLFNGGVPTGSPIGGTGGPLDFGLQTATGTYTIVSTNPGTGCTINMTGTATIIVSPSPIEYSVTGTGSYCSGGPGIVIGVSNSQTGVNYQLMNGGPIGSPVPGVTGSPISFPPQTTAGTYTVLATSTSTVTPTPCTTTMGGSATITVNPPPTVFTVTGGGGYCAGGTGVTVGLTGSTVGVNYQLVLSGPVGSPVVGTGSAISFGLQATGGTYTVTATNATTGCNIAMSGSATVTVNPLPIAYTVSGGGSYCTGGVTVSLSGSQTGKKYQLYNSGTPVGSPIVGTGSALSFTSVTSPGTITILAIDTVTLCTNNMSGSATVTPLTLPTVYYVTGSGPYCAGGTGEHIFLSFSNIGINYQLYLGGTAIGGYLPGAASALDFGAQTVIGTYTIVATNPISGCTSSMSGSVMVTTNPLPVVDTLTGGGGYCAGGIGVPVGLNSSTTGINYQLFNGTTAEGIAVPGTGSAFNFGLETASGTYFVIATNAATGCTDTMHGSAVVTVNPLPASIAGNTNVCPGNMTTLADASTGGTWSSSNTSTATTDAAGNVTGVATGTTTITYTLPTGCVTTTTVSVNSIPPAIGGTTSVCLGATAALFDVAGGGTWSSGNTSVATITLFGGAVTSVSAGTATITYTTGIGCTTTLVETVNPLPQAIGGTPAVCTGLTTALSDTGSGTWTSSNLVVATVGVSSGIVSGLIPGTTTVTYTAVTGCTTGVVVTVSQTPAAITGAAAVCVSSTITVADGTSGGSWSSNSTTTATVNSATGVVLGVGAGTAAITYTMPSGCTAVTIITVNPLPLLITGVASVCTGFTTSLFETATGGTWSSSNSGQATVGAATGVVGGILASTPVITYTLPTGCVTTITVTVSLTPSAIAGAASVCSGATITLSDGISGGSWSSGSTSTATVGPITGVVTGVSPGPVTISYTMASGCFVSKPITVNPAPSPITVVGAASVCTGVTIALSDAVTGGVWSSNNTTLATVGSGSGIVGGVATGTPTISYILGTCATTISVTVNPTPAPISGPAAVCTGSTITLTDATSGGTWGTSDITRATVGLTSGVVTGVALGTPNISYAMPTGCYALKLISVNTTPALIIGIATVCTGVTTTLTDATTGGTWSTSNTTLATVVPASGVVTGVSAGFPNLSYTLSTGCYVATPLTVNTSPVAISGNPSICLGLTSALTDGSGTGLWSSNNTSIATVNLVTGVAGGAAIGSTTITYTLPSGCTTVLPVTVNPQPGPISGAASLCMGLTTTLSDGTTGGVWSSNNTSFASIGSASGTVTPVAPGTLQLFYTLPAGCSSSFLMTINPAPAAITGSNQLCVASTTSLGDTPFGGTWSSSNTAQATVGSLTGTVTGVSAGTTVITYTLPAGCAATLPMTVNALPSAITGSNAVCVHATTTLNSTPAGGVWTSSNTSLATVGSTGTVSGIAAGTLIITYSSAAGCQATALITVNALPAVSGVTGGGAYCAGGAGLSIGLSGSATGISYQLYNPLPEGSAVAGTGSAITFGTYFAAGTNVAIATNTVTGCSDSMSGSALIVINPLPTAYYVTGGGSYCAGGGGVPVGLFGSNTGVSYQLYNGGLALGSPVPGTGSAITFGSETLAGTYTVVATTATLAVCPATMSGSVSVVINPLPTVFNVTGGGTYCTGTTGVTIGLSSSTVGINYQLLIGGSTSVGAPLAGTGGALSFGSFTTLGTYTIVATNPATGCVSTMLGSAIVSSTTPPPAFTISISGTGSYCSGTTAPTISMSGSTSGVNYQLFVGASPISGLFAGTGSGINFGAQPDPGVYTVTGTSTLTGCTSVMTGSVTVTVLPLPAIFTLSGGGDYCFGGAGVTATLSGSATGVLYKLFLGSSLVGSLPGTGGPLTSPLLTTGGIYTATATTTLTACSATMAGAATVIVNPLPNVYAVTGGGSYCAGLSGLPVGLSNSDVTNTYQLYLGGTPVGAPISGTGSAISFGLQTTAGTYTIVATNSATSCTNTMSGSAIITITSLPTSYTVGGGGSYCAGGTGVDINLPHSNTGTSYQLYDGLIPMGLAIAGTGFSIDFGLNTTPGTYTVTATASATGCTATMAGSVLVVIDPLPAAFSVTGGGSYCVGGSGVHVGLSGSLTGSTYQLYVNGIAIGSAMAAAGDPLDFGTQTDAGTYTVIATSTTTPCSSIMTGSVTVSINPLPTTHNVTGGGSFCTGGTGVHVGLNGSNPGIQYQLVIGGISVGLPVAGTGSALDFGLQTVTGTYTVTAMNIATGCTSTMSGSVSVSTIAPPAVYTLIGGGSYCAGGSGVDIGLSGSATGVSYQLFNGAVASGSALVGSGTSLDFGLRTGAGAYTVVATNLTSTCTSNMSDTVTVTINPLPTVYTVTGGGSYCPGGAGVNVSLSGSTAGISYQLFNGGIAVGSPVTGTGTILNFGLEPAAAAPYTAVATNLVTGCTSNMTGGVTVSTYPVPGAYSVLGGGNYCAGLAGMDISLGGSAVGVNYQLYIGTTSPIGSPVSGTGAAIDFGLDTAAGTYTVVATNASTGCTNTMTGSASITITPLPAVYTVSGGGGYCAGGAGSDVALSGSSTGVNYQLYRGASPVGSIWPGTGAALDFGMQTVAGTYTVVAANAVAGCQSAMLGSAVVSVSALPIAYSVTGGGNYCAGSTGVHIGLSGSNMGIHYQLYNDTLPVGSPVSGTGSALNFGVFTSAGSYTVVAENIATSCTNNMTGGASVIINPLPTVYMVTGSGSYCTGGAGVHVYTSGSDTGVNYQLFNGPSTVGGSISGTGSAIDFGAQTTAGNYTVIATNAITGCTRNMADSALITVVAPPTAYTVTGGGSFCAGGVGSLVSITGSATGVNYQVYFGTLPTGTPQAGTGYPLNLGFEALPGTYTVTATNTSTGCTNIMTGTATVSVNPVPAIYTLSGGGSFCAGGAGADVAIGGSNIGINYQLYNGSSPVGSAVAGTGSAIDFGLQTAAGIYTVVAVSPGTSCSSNMSGAIPITINPLPSVYTVSGGGSYCAGGIGVRVGQTGSDMGISYQLYNGLSAIGSPVTGTGSAISFGLQMAGGTYTVVATNTATACTIDMAGSASITVNSVPAVYAVIGGGSYCSGGVGYHIGLSESTAGIEYILLKGGVPFDTTSGTGAPLDFGLETTAGVYTATALNTATSCASNMSGSAAIAVNPLPVVYTVTGGGSYCAGSAGVHIGLSGSDDSDVNYQLYIGSTPVGSIARGTTFALGFGLETLPGTYKVVATNGVTGCTSNMADSASISVTPTVVPSVSVSSAIGDTVCTGTLTSFTATVTNGGATPAYSWYVNGVHTTATTSAFSYVPTGGDVVSVTITSSAVCPLPDTASSALTMTVLPNLTPSVSISVIPGDTVCRGTGVTFTAAPVNGGAAPGYTWRLNGATVVGTGPSYSYTPDSADVVLCLMASSYQCRTDTITLSNSISMTVETPAVPVVHITFNEGYSMNGFSYIDTLTALVTNGGFAPTYQWSVNGVEVPGATTAVFITDSLPANALVSCLVVNNNACGSLPSSGQAVVTLSNEGVKNVIAGVSDIRLVPNPNTGTFTVKGTLGNTADEEVSLEITDMLGQVIYKDKVMTHGGVLNEKIQLGSSIANGMYLLNVRSGVQNVVFHMVIEQ